MSLSASIRITATDGASQQIRAVGDAASKMASTLQSAGKGAASGLGQVDSAAQKSASSVQRAAQAFSAFGQAAGRLGQAGKVVSGLLTDAARAAAESEVVQQRLVASVEATGKAYDEYADQIDKAVEAGMKLSFDDEDVAGAISTLTQATGDAEAALQNLAVAEDLARGKGISLATASEIVGKVAAGNVGILSRYGIVLEQGATAQDALAAIQARYAGQSEAYAATTQGAWDRLATTLGNFEEELGAAAGPLQGVIGLLPGLAEGFRIAQEAGAALTGGEGLAGLATSLEAGLAAIGPFGLALAGLAVVGGGVLLMVKNQIDANNELSQSYHELAAAMAQTGDVRLTSLAEGLRFDPEDLKGKALGDGSMGDLLIGSAKAAGELNVALSQVTDSAVAADASVGDLVATAFALKTQIGSGFFADFDAGDFKATMDDVNMVLKEAGPAGDAARAGLSNLEHELIRGDITASQFQERVHAIVAFLPEWNAAAEAAAEAQRTQADAIGVTTDKLGPFIAASERAAEIEEQKRVAFAASIDTTRQNAEAARYYGDSIGLTAASQAELTRAVDDGNLTLDEARQRADALKQAQDALANTLRGTLLPSVAGVAGGFGDLVRPGEDVLDTLARIAPMASNVDDAFAGLADGLNDAVQGLGSVLGLFSAMDQIGGQSNRAAEIAQNVVGDPGVYAAVDDLLRDGLITIDEYRAAQAAEVGIVADNVAVQNDLNAIRTRSIPLLAEQEASLRAYMDELERTSETNPALAQQALYLMDAGNQAKVAAAYSTAYAASLGEIPPEAATDIIVSAAQADPILRGILESYGLIEVGANGEITVNFENQTTLDTLKGTLEDINDTLWQVGIAITGDPALEIARTKQALDNLPKDVQIALHYAVDNAPAVANDLYASKPAAAPATVGARDEATPVVSGAAAAAGTYASGDYTAHLTAVDDSSSVVARAMQAAHAFADGTYEATLGAGDEASSVVARAMQAAHAWADGSYEARLTAADSSGSVVAQAMQAANAYANGEYQAHLIAGDFSGPVVTQATGAATGYANGEYDASLTATDSASSVAARAMQAAYAFAGGAYEADLTARDDASSVVARVMEAVSALDGMTATVTINAQQTGPAIPGMALGGVVRAVPGARHGRVITVGEAGEENVLLPFGSMVVPHAASGSRVLSGSADYRTRGQALRANASELRGNLQDTGLGAGAGDAAAAGTEAGDAYGAAFSDAAAASTDLGGVLAQVGQLKDELLASLKGGASGFADISGQVAQFNDQVAQLVGGLGGAAKATDQATGQMSDDIDSVADTAKDAGSDAGKDLGSGLKTGIKKGGGQQALDDLQSRLDDLSKTTVTPEVEADDKQASNAIAGTSKDIQQLDNKSAEVEIKVDDDEWQKFVDDVAKVDGSTVTVNVDTKGGKDKSGKSGMLLGGTVHALVPAARLGRVVTVGEAGPEAVVLPYGSLVVPHGAAAGRGGGGEGGTTYVFNAAVHLHPATPDIGRAIEAQLTMGARG